MLNVNLTEDFMNELHDLVSDIEETYYELLQGVIDIDTYLKAKDRYLAKTMDAIVNHIDEYDK